MRKFVSLLAVAMLLAACGGDEGQEEDTTTTSSSLVTTAAPLTTISPTTTAPEEITVDEAQPGIEEAAEPQTTEPVQVDEIDAVTTLRAVGPVRIGMTVSEASAETGVTLRRDFGRQGTDSCYYITPGAAMRGVSIMVVDERIARIEIDSPSEIATRSGVRIGTSASNLQTVYPDNIQRAAAGVAEGEAMAFVPNDDTDADYRIYFEIEDGQVARYRVGIKPAVDYLRGCPDQ